LFSTKTHGLHHDYPRYWRLPVRKHKHTAQTPAHSHASTLLQSQSTHNGAQINRYHKWHHWSLVLQRQPTWLKLSLCQVRVKFYFLKLNLLPCSIKRYPNATVFIQLWKVHVTEKSWLIHPLKIFSYNLIKRSFKYDFILNFPKSAVLEVDQ